MTLADEITRLGHALKSAQERIANLRALLHAREDDTDAEAVIRNQNDHYATGKVAGEVWARADLEALREKARAHVAAISVESMNRTLVALRTELDKPSGASSLAERSEAMALLDKAGVLTHMIGGGSIENQRATLPERVAVLAADVKREEAVADAWRALAMARARLLDKTDGKRGLAQACQDEQTALAALRALGIDPDSGEPVAAVLDPVAVIRAAIPEAQRHRMTPAPTAIPASLTLEAARDMLRAEGWDGSIPSLLRNPKAAIAQFEHPSSPMHRTPTIAILRAFVAGQGAGGEK